MCSVCHVVQYRDGLTCMCVFTTSAGCVTTDAKIPANTPQLKFSRGARPAGPSSKTDTHTHENFRCALRKNIKTDTHTHMCTHTVRQCPLALAIDHDIDPREGSISEQCRCETWVQSSWSLSLTHTPQGSIHTAVVIPPTLKHTHIYIIAAKNSNMIEK